jgi:hypothetical protein
MAITYEVNPKVPGVKASNKVNLLLTQLRQKVSDISTFY